MADEKQAEQFSWGKFFSGIFSPLGYFKTIADVLRILIILLMCWGVYVLGVRIHAALSPKKPQPAVFTVNDQVGGSVQNSADQKKYNLGIFNF